MTKILTTLTVASILVLAAMSRGSATEVEIRYARECPSVEMTDTSLVARFATKPGGDCGEHDYTWMYALDDLWLGVRWDFNPNSGISTTGLAIAPTLEALDPNLKQCLFTGPNNDYVNEWYVPRGTSCNGRGKLDGRHRHYVGGKVCILPASNCFLIDWLTPLGKERALRTIDTAKRPTQGVDAR